MNTLETIQRELARSLMRAPRHTHNEIVLKECGLMPIQQLVDRLTVAFYKRAEKMVSGRLVHDLISEEIEIAESRPINPYDYTTNPSDITDSAATQGFLHKAITSANRLGVTLDQTCTKNELKRAATDCWEYKVSSKIANRDRLCYMRDDDFIKSMTPRKINQHSDELWWVKAKTGGLCLPSINDEPPACKLCSQPLTLIHMLLHCPAITLPQSVDWLTMADGLALGDDWSSEQRDQFDPLQYWLLDERSPADRLRVGSFVRKQYNHYNQLCPMDQYWLSMTRWKKSTRKPKITTVLIKTSGPALSTGTAPGPTTKKHKKLALAPGPIKKRHRLPTTLCQTDTTTRPEPKIFKKT